MSATLTVFGIAGSKKVQVHRGGQEAERLCHKLKCASGADPVKLAGSIRSAIEISTSHHPSSIIQRAVWLYVRFNLSLRDVEELMAERGVEVSYDTILR